MPGATETDFFERADVMDTKGCPTPKIEHPRDAIIKVTACAICGSDLHIFDGVIASMESGDIIGHETMGEVLTGVIFASLPSSLPARLCIDRISTTPTLSTSAIA